MMSIIEPKANGDAANVHARALGFDYVAHGGPLNTHIWLFWNDPLQISDIVWKERFVTYKCIVCADSDPVQVSVVYGTHDQISRHHLWEDITGEGQGLSIPWVVMGDFNTISDWLEKQGGDRRDDGSMLDFNTFQVRAGLSDLGYTGNPFTWSNNQQEDSRVWECLDRVLANGQVLSQFPAAQVTHLPRIMSDHCPLLLHTSNPTPRPSRFYYQKMWHSHPGFSNFVRQNWDGRLHTNPLLNFGLKLKRLRRALKDWNWHVFGNINVKQRTLASRIAVLENNLQHHWDSRDLSTANSDLGVLEAAQLDLLQTKAKMAWVLDGDRNSKLFHAAIKVRRQQARVNLDIGDGVFTNDTDTIGSSAVNFFSSLFQGYTPPPPDSVFSDIDSSISLDDNSMLCRLPAEDEIYAEIQAMNPDSQAINLQKSKIFFSSNIRDARKNSLLQLLYFVGVFPITYLGAPLFRGAARIDFFDYLVEKVRVKTAEWMKNFISMAGRVVLVNSVLSTIPMHVIACLSVPKTTLRRIESIMSNFIWDQGVYKSRHWVSWQHLCRTKGAGGLGVHSLIDMQMAFKGKLAWAFIAADSMWARFMRSKYKPGAKGSPAWRAFHHLIPHVKQQCKWLLGKGDTTVLAWSNLMGLNPSLVISHMVMRQVLQSPNLKDALSSALPPILRRHVDTITFSNAQDRIIWTGSSNGVFSLKSFRRSIQTHSPVLSWTKALWCSWLPPKVTLFMWRLFLGALPTDNRLTSLGLPIVSRYPCCLSAVETINHLFFEGDWGKALWDYLHNTRGLPRCVSLANLRSLFPRRKPTSFNGCMDLGLLCCGLWDIWVNRNCKRHDEATMPLLVSLKKWADSICLRLPSNLKNTRIMSPSSRILFLPPERIFGSWRFWKPGWNGSTLTVGIAVKPHNCHGGAILRDHLGSFQRAFATTLDKSSDLRELLCFTLLAMRQLRVSRWQTNGFSARCICPGQNNPALALAYSDSDGLFDLLDLPQAVMHGLHGDSFGHFCSGSSYIHSGHLFIRDDIPSRSRRSPGLHYLI
ncbi:hypothetical protein QQ045_012200 [Rhodiola kirilowii]